MSAQRCELRHKPGAIACKCGRFLALKGVRLSADDPGPWGIYEVCPMCLRRVEYGHHSGLTIEGAAAKVEELHRAVCPSPIARIDDAVAKLEDPGETAEQKQWTIDQALRVLLGQEYDQWVRDWAKAEGRAWSTGAEH